MSVNGLFANAQQTWAVAAGEVLFQEGVPGSHMFGVISGEVVLHHAGREVARIGPGGVFGEMALIDHGTRTLTAAAVADTHLAVIDRPTFLYLVHETPTFALDVMSAMAERIRVADGL